MNNRTLIVIGVVFILVASVIYYFFFYSTAPSTTPTPPASQNPFGEPSPNTNPSEVPNVPSGDIVLQTQTGSSVIVPDFTKNKQSFPIGSHTYYFVTNNQETQGDNAEFDIVYGTDSSISIGLFKEPLKQVRLAAEQSVRNVLSLPDATICTLKISVAVPYDVNQFYSGQNLGLSFCPGAIQLP